MRELRISYASDFNLLKTDASGHSVAVLHLRSNGLGISNVTTHLPSIESAPLNGPILPDAIPPGLPGKRKFHRIPRTVLWSGGIVIAASIALIPWSRSGIKNPYIHSPRLTEAQLNRR